MSTKLSSTMSNSPEVDSFGILSHPQQPATTVHPPYHIAPLSPSIPYLSKHLRASQHIQENLFRWGITEEVVHRSNGFTSVGEQAQLLKKVDLQECFDWHQVERDVMQYLFENLLEIENQEQELGLKISKKHSVKVKLEKELESLREESHQLNSFTSEDHIQYLWKQVDMENKHLDNWSCEIMAMQEQLSSYKVQCQEKVNSLQKITLQHHKTLQKMKNAYEEMRSKIFDPDKLFREKAELKQLLHEEKNQHETLLHIFQKRKKKLKDLHSEIQRLTEECEILSNTLVECIASESEETQFLTPNLKRKQVKTLEYDMKTLIRRKLTLTPFRPRYHSESFESYEFEKLMHEWRCLNMLPFEEIHTSNDMKSKKKYIKSYYLFRQQRCNESLNDYYNSKETFFEDIMKEPFRERKANESIETYALLKEQYEKRVFREFRPQYLIEDNAQYQIKTELHQRKLDWKPFEVNIQMVDDEKIAQQVEYLKSFSYRDQYPLETTESYLLALKGHYKQFYSLKDTLLEGLPNTEVTSVLQYIKEKEKAQIKKLSQGKQNSQSVPNMSKYAENMKIRTFDDLLQALSPMLKEKLILEKSMKRAKKLSKSEAK